METTESQMTDEPTSPEAKSMFERKVNFFQAVFSYMFAAGFVRVWIQLLQRTDKAHGNIEFLIDAAFVIFVTFAVIYCLLWAIAHTVKFVKLYLEE